MSRRRTLFLFIRYSLVPSLKSLLVTTTSSYGISSILQSEKVIETSAKLTGLILSVPLKIISSIFAPLRLLTLDSPKTHLIASEILLLPEPLGPTIAVTPGGNFIIVLFKKLLKPLICNSLSNNFPPTLTKSRYNIWISLMHFALYSRNLSNLQL